MALIAGIRFQFDLNFHEIDLQGAESYLIDITSRYSDIIYNQKTDVQVKLEEGSLKATLLVLAHYISESGNMDLFVQELIT